MAEQHLVSAGTLHAAIVYGFEHDQEEHEFLATVALLRMVPYPLRAQKYFSLLVGIRWTMRMVELDAQLGSRIASALQEN